MASSLQLANCDMPSLYICANQTSVAAQRTYLAFLKTGMVLQIIGVIAALYEPINQNLKVVAPLFAAFLFFISLVLTLILKIKHYEKIWYGGRAAAESAKTSAWKYAVCSEPYCTDLPDQTADEIFTKNLKAILEQRGNLADAIGAEFPAGPQITEKMRVIRRLSTSERIEIYANQRVTGQRNWYAEKANENKKSADRLFLVFISMQLLTTIFALARIAMPDLINLTGIFSVVGTSTLAWLQIKKHQELAQAYAVTAHELGFVAEKSRHVRSDADFSNFVADAEMAISREHTLWVARRETM